MGALQRHLLSCRHFLKATTCLFLDLGRLILLPRVSAHKTYQCYADNITCQLFKHKLWHNPRPTKRPTWAIGISSMTNVGVRWDGCIAYGLHIKYSAIDLLNYILEPKVPESWWEVIESMFNGEVAPASKRATPTSSASEWAMDASTLDIATNLPTWLVQEKSWAMEPCIYLIHSWCGMWWEEFLDCQQILIGCVDILRHLWWWEVRETN